MTTAVSTAGRGHAARRATSAPRPAAPAAAPVRPAGDVLATQAPKGRSPVGDAVNRAVWATNRGTIDRAAVFTSGSVEAIWRNDTDSRTNEIMDRVIAEIGRAKGEVVIQTYLWDLDKPASQKLMAALAAKQRENPDFKVRVYYARQWSPLDDLPEELAKHGVKAEVARYFDVKAKASNHSKMFVFDGHTGVVASANVENKNMIDTGLVLRGPVVGSMLKDFDQAWMTASKWHAPGGTEAPKPTKALPHVVLPAPTRATQPEVPITLLTKAGNGIDVDQPRRNDANAALLAAFAAARTEIKVQTPNLNDQAVWSSLMAAAKRGVKVKLLVPYHFNQVKAQLAGGNNSAMRRWIAQAPADVRANVELRWFSTDGEAKKYNHTKYYSVDDSWLYTGSQNMDEMSWSVCRELGVGIDDPATVRRLDAATFDASWATSPRAGFHWYDEVLLPPARSWGERAKRIFTNPKGLVSEVFNPFSGLGEPLKEKIKIG